MRGVALRGCRIERIARDFVVKKVSGHLSMLLLLLLTMMSGRGRDHVFIQHRTHGLRAHQGARAVHTADITAADTAANIARFVALLVFLIFYLRPINR